MISSYILMALAGLGMLFGLSNSNMIEFVSSIILFIFSLMCYEHFNRLKEITEQQRRIELNQRSLILLLNDRKSNKEDKEDEQ